MAELSAGALAHLVLRTRTRRVLMTCHLPSSHIIFVFNAHGICIVLCIIHGESDYEITLILPINHGLDVYERHLLVDNDSVLILNGEVRLNDNEEFGIYHDVAHAHFLIHSLVAEDQLDIH